MILFIIKLLFVLWAKHKKVSDTFFWTDTFDTGHIKYKERYLADRTKITENYLAGDRYYRIIGDKYETTVYFEKFEKQYLSWRWGL